MEKFEYSSRQQKSTVAKNRMKWRKEVIFEYHCMESYRQWHEILCLWCMRRIK